MPPIDVQQLSTRIKTRLNERRDEDFVPGPISFSEQKFSDPIRASIDKVLNRGEEATGLVKGIVSRVPGLVREKTSDFFEQEEERRKRQTLGEEFVTEFIERPAKVLKAISVDFPRLILGSLSSTGKSVIEAAYSPIIGKSETREALKGDPKLEQILFKGEAKSWQEMKEDIDRYTADSPLATDWEKRHLGTTLAVGGFIADAWVGGGGKGKIGTKVLKELVEETDEALVREILINNKVPAELAERAAPKVARATTIKEVENAVNNAARVVLTESGSATSRAVTLDEFTGAPVREISIEDIATPVRGRAKQETIDAVVEEGLQRPIILRRVGDEFEIVDGANRLAGVKARGENTIRAVIEEEIPPLRGQFDIENAATQATAIKESFRNFEGVPQELQPLAKEASKFKSAEEFTNSFLKSKDREIRLAAFSDDFRDFTAGKNRSERFSDFWNKVTGGGRPPVDNTVTLKGPSELPPPTPGNIEKFRDTRGKIARARDFFLEHLQDEMIRVRRLVTDKRLKITDESNPYDAEIAFHGRVGSRLEDLRDIAKQIDKEVVEVAKKQKMKDELLTKEVNEYLIARHAPERNAALGDGAAGIKTADAVARLAELEGKPYAKELKRIADKIQKLNNETLDILKQGEVISDELYDTLRNKYKNHIPLYRVFEHEEDFAGAIARGFNVKDTGIKKAVGSEREVADVLGNVVFNYEQAVIRSEKNRVDLSTLKMIRDNSEALSDLFTIRKPRAIGKTFDDKPILEKVTDPQTLVMREKGKPLFIEIQDPGLAIALRGVGRERLSGMMRGVAAITRLYSGLHTRFNPEFAFSNKVRDIQEVLVYSAAQGEVKGRGAAKIAAREAMLENERAVIDLIRGKDTTGAKLYAQMKEDGGTTGGLGLSTRKQIEIDITEIRKMNRSNPRVAAKKALELVDTWNTIFEDSSRLSVYRQALEGGASRQRAAVLAKESSVNFNKFGKQGPIINALWIFSNASIQGTTKTIRAMKDPKVAATVGAAVFGSVYAVAEWNDRIDPDWRNKIRTWDRLNSLAIMLPAEEGEGVKYITVPVSWGIKPIKVIADEMLDLATGNGKGLTAAASSVLVATLEAYNPAGGSDIVSTITPTILDIPVEVARNEAWHGGAIKPDWDRNAPASIQYFASLRDSTTGQIAIGISKGLSGIGIEVSPADFHYAYEQLIGGAGRAVNKTVNTLTAVGGGELPDERDIPVVSRFYKALPDEEVGSGAKEFEMIATLLEGQSRERFYLNQQAEDSLQQLDNVPASEAAKMFQEIKAADPDLAKTILKLKKEKEKGLTFIDRKILQLGVENGERAKFLKQKFDSLESDSERATLWQEYKTKGILTKNVIKQLNALYSED